MRSETGWVGRRYLLHPYLAVPRLLASRLTTRHREEGGGTAEEQRLREVAVRYVKAEMPSLLEIGGGFRPVANGLGDLFATRTATDIREYYDTPPDSSAVVTDPGVQFLWDDITETSLPEESFDLIASWDVLEHVNDPEAFAIACHKLLKPGGVLYVSYNPFFAINGGHSLCTTDIPWGHALLTRRDLEAFWKRSPSRSERLEFFDKWLNRMTMKTFQDVLQSIGLSIAEWKTDDVESLRRVIDEPTLEQLARLHPGAGEADLVARRVEVVAIR